MTAGVSRDREAFERLPVGVFTATVLGAVDWFSSALHDATGTTQAQTLGEAWIYLLHPDDMESTAWRWSVALDTGAPFVATVRTRIADGSYRPYLWQARLVHDEQSRPYWLGTMQDLSVAAATTADQT